MMVGYLSILEDIWHPVIESTRGGVHLGCMANCDTVWVRGGGQYYIFIIDGRWEEP